MLKGAYADDFYNILLKVIHNSRLTFVCAIPFWMEERFIKRTKEAANFLSTGGVTSIAVGGVEIIIALEEHTPGEDIFIIRLYNYKQYLTTDKSRCD